MRATSLSWSGSLIYMVFLPGDSTTIYGMSFLDLAKDDPRWSKCRGFLRDLL
jgi:hypothetical protein